MAEHKVGLPQDGPGTGIRTLTVNPAGGVGPVDQEVVTLGKADGTLLEDLALGGGKTLADLYAQLASIATNTGTDADAGGKTLGDLWTLLGAISTNDDITRTTAANLIKGTNTLSDLAALLEDIDVDVEAVRTAVLGQLNVAVQNWPADQLVHATALPLPAGAATEATLAGRLKPNDNVRDQYTRLEVLDDFVGTGASVDKAFANPTDCIWVLAQGGTARVTSTDQTPTASRGVPCLDGTPFPLPFSPADKTIRVFAGGAVTVTCWAQRY